MATCHESGFSCSDILEHYRPSAVLRFKISLWFQCSWSLEQWYENRYVKSKVHDGVLESLALTKNVYKAVNIFWTKRQKTHSYDYTGNLSDINCFCVRLPQQQWRKLPPTQVAGGAGLYLGRLWDTFLYLGSVLGIVLYLGPLCFFLIFGHFVTFFNHDVPFVFSHQKKIA